MRKLRWWYYEYRRLRRLLQPEPSARALINAVGAFWLWRQGAKREHRIKLWKNTAGWYAVDIAIPHKRLALEADGAPHKQRRQQDVVRDYRLGEVGWRVLRFDYDEILRYPRRVRREARAFIRQH